MYVWHFSHNAEAMNNLLRNPVFLQLRWRPQANSWPSEVIDLEVRIPSTTDDGRF